jgi:hypothetical protein
MTRRAVELVRYVSPFGSPAGMTRDEAERRLARDDRVYCELVAAGVAGALRAPYIEYPRETSARRRTRPAVR